MLQINEILEWNLTSNEEIEELRRKLEGLSKKKSDRRQPSEKRAD